MNKINESGILSRNPYIECLTRIVEEKAESRHEFLTIVVREIKKLTQSGTVHVFESDKTHSRLNLILTSGNEDEKIPELQSLAVRHSLINHKNPLLINETVPGERKFQDSERTNGLICFIPVTEGNNISAEFVLVKNTGSFHLSQAIEIQVILDLLWKIAAVHRNVEEAKKQKEKAEENEKMKNNFIINFSHDIRTPLNAIVGFSNLLAESGQSTETRKKYVNIILDSSEELLSVSRNFTELSNLEYNLQRTTIQAVNIKKVMMDFADTFSSNARTKNIKLSINIDLRENDTAINTDENKFNQIYYAIIDNSLKFTYSGEIELGCRRTGDFIEFRVKDTGIGIPPGSRGNIFNYFSSGEMELSKKTEGTGMGLAIANAYVKHLNGNIWFTSTEGKGSTFFFTLPAPATPAQMTKSQASADAENAGKKERKVILVAEDDDNNYSLIERIISKEHHKIIRAKNGQEAVDICKSKKIDLVLMDIKMPVMNGYDAAKQILAFNRGMKIIAQTAYLSDRDVAIDIGCIDFIAKPFSRTQLMSLINHYI